MPRTPAAKTSRYSVDPAKLGLALDARGLLPLAEARARVRSAKIFARGEHHDVPGQPFKPTDADRLWFALLSLESAEEFVREATRLRWEFPLRGRDNVDALDRYGAGALPWLEAMLRRGFPEFPIFQECLEAMLVAAGPDAARVVVRTRRAGDPDPDGLGLVLDWLRAHGTSAYEALGTAAIGGDPDAQRALGALAKRSPTTRRALVKALGKTRAEALLADRGGGTAGGDGAELTAAAILRVLDAAAAAPISERLPWPTLQASAGHFELHAMRLVAVRARRGDDWGILIEVAQGDILNRKVRWPAVVQRFTYGSRVAPGGRYLEDARPLGIVAKGGQLLAPVRATVDAALAKKLDLRPGRSTTGAVESWPNVLAIRAALALAKDRIFPDPKKLVSVLKVPRPCILVVSDSFAHVDGTALGTGALAKLPSESVAYRSLAEAIAERDPTRFRPGKPTTDWRLHATRKQPFSWGS